MYEPELSILRVWNPNSQRNPIYPDYLDSLKDHESWVVLASILSQPTCTPKIIHHVIERKGFSKGYEYLLEIITRNPNTELRTLDLIMNDTLVEPRVILFEYDFDVVFCPERVFAIFVRVDEPFQVKLSCLFIRLADFMNERKEIFTGK